MMSSGEFDLRTRIGMEAFAPEATCSRAKCEAAATRRIEWRNPRIHSEDRIKIWLTCDEHLEFLLGFLKSRGFPVRLHAVDDPVNEEPIE
ncbi:hypothetical protein [uncultured Gulosibacter sp.]|uniref:hypothetical protein n=1 Tax=uncultured Gulosibacter sp. TaxID=1339167 RepID=UPI0037DC3B2C